MKALLLCPARRSAVQLLAEETPLVLAPLLGKCLLEYWIEDLAGRGCRDILIVVSDRAEQVRTAVGDGARWGVALNVVEEPRELSIGEARHRFGDAAGAASAHVATLNHLPGQANHPLFDSYATWVRGVQAWIPHTQTPLSIGTCEVMPGVWIGRRARIDATARLVAPCWIGDYATVAGDAVIGPATVLEEGVVISSGVRVAGSVIGPDTRVGPHTTITHSLVHRHTLTHCGTGSCLRVPDACWLSSLSAAPAPRARPTQSLPMKITNDGRILRVADLAELSMHNAGRVQRDVLASLTTALAGIEIDLAETRFLDAQGLAALCRLQRSAGALGLGVRLLHPSPQVRQLLELTRMQEFFGIDQTEPVRSEWLPATFPPLAAAV